jgi:hypothetical protein
MVAFCYPKDNQVSGCSPARRLGVEFHWHVCMKTM